MIILESESYDERRSEDYLYTILETYSQARQTLVANDVNNENVYPDITRCSAITLVNQDYRGFDGKLLRSKSHDCLRTSLLPDFTMSNFEGDSQIEEESKDFDSKQVEIFLSPTQYDFLPMPHHDLNYGPNERLQVTPYQYYAPKRSVQKSEEES